jgi:hypothetical protein
MGHDAGFDVFLSYARIDGAVAAELNGWLRMRQLDGDGGDGRNALPSR